VAIARRELDELAERLGIALPPAARPGADLAVRTDRQLPWPPPAVLLPAGDGWVHPGPDTAWPAFIEMALALGATPPAVGAIWPSLVELTVDVLDAEATAWMLPAVAVRRTPSAPDPLPELAAAALTDATVVVLGTAWATPLVGLVLAQLGARVVRIEHPARPDPFPLREALVRGQEVVALDLGVVRERDRCAAIVARADLVVVGHPPRVLSNAGLVPGCPVLHVAAFVDHDGPGYGPAAEARGGWAARHDPPRLARTSVADPVAGMVGALAAADLVTSGTAGASARVSLEGAVGRLLDRERRGG
jgi:hypothetical protein